MPKVKRERRSPEEAYKYMDARLRAGVAGSRTEAKRTKTPWKIFAVALAAVVLLAVAGLIAALFLGKSTPAPTARVASATPTADSCLDDKGNLPAFVQQVGQQIGMAAKIVPEATTMAAARGGLYRVTMLYHPELGDGDEKRIERATGVLDPRFCTTTVSSVGGQ